ncbi:prolyl oligopeptidase family serine peptidase [Actinomycetaceae bacterium TAE3-ERU4]|nr:prolyl oligopeptidase family serine peptidase [Actinomycetaceae bacterium TAE3-ERU4]
MKSLTPAAYGTWESPLKSSTLTSRRVQMSGLRIDSFDTYWIEHRLHEEGRHVLLRRRSDGITGEVLPLTPEDQLMDVATNVNEYGGRAYAVSEGVIVANQITDGRVYKFDLNDPMRSLIPLTPGFTSRYGDFEIDLARGLVYAVEESHSDAVSNRLVAIPLDGSGARNPEEIKEIYSAADFMAAPALSPDGLGLAWITWEHPHMPWTQSALHVGRLDVGGQLKEHLVLVDSENVCVYEPRWSTGGDLIHIDDTSGWANFYRTEGFDFLNDRFCAPEKRLKTRLLHPSPKAFSNPHWRLGLHTYDNFSGNEIICSWTVAGSKRLGVMNLENGQLEEADTSWQPIGNVTCQDGRVVFLASSPSDSMSVVQIYKGQTQVLRGSADWMMDDRDISYAQPMTWRTTDGKAAYGYFYPPKNSRYIPLQGELPPVIVNVHAGPTSAAKTGLSWEVQFWTNRGFAYFDVDFRGSTGHGKVYREELTGNWGKMDSQDVIEGLEYLASRGLIDPDRAVVRGFSSGAFTAINTIWQSQVFKAASAVSGFWDLEGLKSRTSKFESYLVEHLLGKDPNTVIECSPISHASALNAPILIFQGTEPGLSTLEETERFTNLLEEGGSEYQLEIIEGENHSMDSAKSVEKIFNTELIFFRKHLGISK